MHPCCGILFYVMSGFIQIPKGIEKSFENVFVKVI
jgi:hypothetical protein